MLPPLVGAQCPNRTTVMERAIRGFASDIGDNAIVPKLGTIFNTLSEAYDFYNLYLWEKGFGIRYGKSCLNVERTVCESGFNSFFMSWLFH